MRTCENCGSRVYSLGCTWCNEEAYIAEQESTTERRASMQRQPVESSNIASVGFDPKTQIMEIEFKGGGIYQYTGSGVEAAYKGLIAAESKGKYFTQHIRRDPNIKVSKVG